MARDTNEKVELKKPTIKKISEQVVAPQDVELPVKKAVVKNEAARIMAENMIRDTRGAAIFMDANKVFEALCVPAEEAITYLGGYDPADYFRGGKLHKSFKNFFGERLDEETEEFMMMQAILSPYVGCQLFKQRQQNLYTVLMPKVFSEFELDHDGEYAAEGVYYDTRVIAFTGKGNAPSAFEKDYFNKHIERIRASIAETLKKRGN